MADKFELNSPPSDGITRVVFAPTSNDLLASSWDKTVRLYDTDSNTMRRQFDTPAPCLDTCFLDGTRGFAGCVDKTVRSFDFASGQQSVVGVHDNAVKVVEYDAAKGTLVTGSWDTSVRLWDHRSNQCLGTYPQPDKVYAMTICGDYIVVCTASKHFWIWDSRNMAEPFQRRESGLKYQTRCVAPMPSKEGVVLGSIEGRVAIEYIHAAETGKKNFAFKCHRAKDGDQEVIYPVNAVAFHPTYGTFATGGSDGIVSTWDGNNKKRLYQYQAYDTTVASIAFNNNGSKMAVAVSYMMEQGEKEHPKDSIHVRAVAERQVKPKTAA